MSPSTHRPWGFLEATGASGAASSRTTGAAVATSTNSREPVALELEGDVTGLKEFV